jgi:hypothetical protein
VSCARACVVAAKVYAKFLQPHFASGVCGGAGERRAWEPPNVRRANLLRDTALCRNGCGLTWSRLPLSCQWGWQGSGVRSMSLASTPLTNLMRGVLNKFEIPVPFGNLVQDGGGGKDEGVIRNPSRRSEKDARAVPGAAAGNFALAPTCLCSLVAHAETISRGSTTTTGIDAHEERRPKVIGGRGCAQRGASRRLLEHAPRARQVKACDCHVPLQVPVHFRICTIGSTHPSRRAADGAL